MEQETTRSTEYGLVIVGILAAMFGLALYLVRKDR